MNTAVVHISGLTIAKSVIASIVSRACDEVEGVVQVGSNVLASSLISVFSQHTPSDETPVEVDVVNDKLHVGVHVSVFYGYPFVTLAQQIRAAVAQSLQSQLSCDIDAVDVYIDNLVFPKE